MLAVLFDIFLVDFVIAWRRINEVSQAVEGDFTFCISLALEVVEKSMLFLICNPRAKSREAEPPMTVCALHYLAIFARAMEALPDLLKDFASCHFALPALRF
jgi:hypothetical protein